MTCIYLIRYILDMRVMTSITLFLWMLWHAWWKCHKFMTWMYNIKLLPWQELITTQWTKLSTNLGWWLYAHVRDAVVIASSFQHRNLILVCNLRSSQVAHVRRSRHLGSRTAGSGCIRWNSDWTSLFLTKLVLHFHDPSRPYRAT